MVIIRGGFAQHYLAYKNRVATSWDEEMCYKCEEIVKDELKKTKAATLQELKKLGDNPELEKY
jgi:hypothetical protein